MTSRDRWLALFAATLGVSTACNHDGDAPPVTANEVPSFGDAAIPSATVDPASLNAAAPTTDVTPDASAATMSAPDASVVATPETQPASPNAVKLAWLLPMPDAAMPKPPPAAKPPPVAPKPPPPPPPKNPGPPAPWNTNGPNVNSGAGVSSGASTPVQPPRATVKLQIAAKPGLPAADATKTTSTINVARAHVAACFQKALELDPTIPTMRIVVHATSPGDGKRAAITLDAPKLGTSQAIACVTSALVLSFGGDDQSAATAFNLDVVVSE